MTHELQEVSVVVGQLSGRSLAIVAAVCAGVTLSDVYIGQPLVTLIASDLDVTVAAAQTIITASLAGYAAGLLFLVPLGDRFPARILLRVLPPLGAAALVIGAIAPTLSVVTAATFFAAMFGIVPQILIPLVVTTTAPGLRGKAMAIVQTGMILGMMLSRPALGLLGQYAGWRSAYLVAAIATLVVTIPTSLFLPSREIAEPTSYLGLFRSMGRLVRDSPQLRNVCLRNAFVFAAYNALWGTLTAVLTAPPFDLSVGAASLVGFLGIGSAALAPLAGSTTDRRGARTASMVGLVVLVAALVGFWIGQGSLWVLLVGAFLLPIGLQFGQVATQTTALAVDPAASGRLNTVFMFTTFLGGALGSQVAAQLLPSGGGSTICIEAAICIAIATALTVIPVRAASLRRDQRGLPRHH